MARAALRRRLSWKVATVTAVAEETRNVRTLVLDVPDWPEHRAGQHYVVRITADDGMQASRSYSVASAPEPGGPGTHVELTVERLEDGEVSPYLTDELRAGDQIEVRGPIGGYFVWEPAHGGPLLLVAGGSGIVPLMSMLRHRRRRDLGVPLALVVSVRSPEDLFYAGEYGPETTVVYTRSAPPGHARPPGRLDAAVRVERFGPS